MVIPEKKLQGFFPRPEAEPPPPAPPEPPPPEEPPKPPPLFPWQEGFTIGGALYGDPEVARRAVELDVPLVLSEFTPPDEPLDIDKESTKYLGQLEGSHTNLGYFSAELEKLSPAFEGIAVIAKLAPGMGVLVERNRAILAGLIEQSTIDAEKNEYFFKLYGWLPAMLIDPDTELQTVEDVLKLPYPNSFTEAEMATVRTTIQAVLDKNAEAPLLERSVDELIIEAQRALPLVIPEGTATEYLEMAVVHGLSIAELIRSFQQQMSISPVLSPEEWRSLMTDMGYSDADLEALELVRGQAEELAADWTESQNAMDEFKAGIRDIPDYTLTRAFKDFWVQPGLALLETVQMYRENVSIPLAGAAFKGLIPDMEAEYQRLRASDTSHWRALQLAFDDWDANWFLKYMIMENVVDPLSYVGWGIAGRLAKALPYKPLTKIAALERGIMNVIDIPADGVKYLWRKLPRTLGQRAMKQEQITGQVVKRFIEKFTGKPLATVSMGDFSRARQAAIKFYMAHPMSEDLAALAGKEFLRHRPFDVTDTVAFARALGVEMPAELATKRVVGGLDEIFEDYFFHAGGTRLAKDEAASQVLKVLDVQPTVVTRKLAGKMLEDRGNTILKVVAELDAAKAPHQALRALMRRNYDVYYDSQKTAAYLARTEMGAFATLTEGIATRVQRIWVSKVDKYVVKPFAEAYLTFGMYGPMNVVEDYFRSALGGVTPRKMNIEAWERLSWGLTTDTNLERYGISEMMGYLERKGADYAHDNWILQMAFLGKKKWATKAYELLVRRPGAVGMDVRRNFMAGRFKQLLEDAGGDSTKKIAAIQGNLPRWIDRKLAKQLEASVYQANLTGTPSVTRGLKDVFTRKKLTGAEVRNILSEYPDVPQVARRLILDSHKDGSLWKNIDEVMEEARVLLRDDFVRSPEFATKQLDDLKEILTKMEVKSPEEMAWAMQQLQVMCNSYGALPDQIIAQSAIRTRGLSATVRQAEIDADFIRLYAFMERSGLTIDDTVKMLQKKVAVAGFASNQVPTVDRMLEVMTMWQRAAADFRAMNMATRSNIFARTPKNLRDADFWNNFYVTMDGQYKIWGKENSKFLGMLESARETMATAFGVKPITRAPIKITGRPLAPQDVAKLMRCRGDDISRSLLDVLTINSKDNFVEYVLTKVRPGDVGFTREAIESVYDQVVSSLWARPETFSYITKSTAQMNAVQRELHNLYITKQYPEEVMTALHKYIDDAADGLDNLMYTPKGKLKPEFAGWQNTRQKAMDEAHKWYYKEYPDYTNANAFDAMMKNIYPYWTYESQRWFWLPRTFVRHPGMFRAFTAFQDNTEYGYIHIPGTSADINPFRGTVFGTLTTRLIREDYPEYYDSLPVAGDFIEGMDFLSRWGFYPGAHFSIPMALMGGLEAQTGETLPSIHRSLLNVLIAEFPESKAVAGLTEMLFNDRFRDYATILQTNRRGAEGIRIWTKIQEGVSLTDEEQAVWTDARREAALYGIGFEQFGLFRMRPDEQHKAYELASQVIFEKTGISPKQQDVLRRRGDRLWDLVGGLSPTNQAVLQSMEYYKWVGLRNPLLPSRMQLIQNKQTLFWDDVENFNNRKSEEMLQAQQDYMAGAIGPSDYITEVRKVYEAKRNYIDDLHASELYKDVPLTMEERKAYYEQTGNVLPVQHPMRELLNLFFEIEPQEMYDPETGEKVIDWDSFWSQRDAIEAAIPEQFKQEWQDYLSRNTIPYELVRREINENYFRPYNRVYEAVLKMRSEEERRLIEEYLRLERLEKDRGRQQAIRDIVGTDGKKLVSSFRSDISNARKALRYANPTLDAWLNFWGRVHTFMTPEAEIAYNSIQVQMGRQ